MRPTKVFFALIALSLNSCVSVPPDGPVCRPLIERVIEQKDAFGVITKVVRPNPKCMKACGEPRCGFCVWMMSDRTQYVAEAKKFHLYGKPWSQIQQESTIVPSEFMARLNAHLIKVCKETNCDQQVNRWRVKWDSLDSILDLGKSP